MNELYAAHPSAPRGAFQLRALLNCFGPFRGRYMLEIPAHWWQDFLESSSGMGDVERKRAFEAWHSARAALATIPEPGLGWARGMAWHDIANALLQRKHIAAAFSAMPAAGLCPLEAVFDLPPTADETIDANHVDEYSRVASVMLKHAEEVHVVDPYLNPCRRDYADVIACLLSTAKTGKCKHLTFWVHLGKLQDKGHTPEELEGHFRAIVRRIGISPSQRISARIVDDRTSTAARLHSRHIFCLNGGITADHGFHRYRGGNVISPISPAILGDLIKWFVDGEHGFDSVVNIDVQ